MAILRLFLVACIVSAFVPNSHAQKPEAVTSSSFSAQKFSEPGKYKVLTWNKTWTDESRKREIPIKIVKCSRRA